MKTLILLVLIFPAALIAAALFPAIFPTEWRKAKNGGF